MKTSQVKEKVAAKVAKGKAKVAKKCSKVAKKCGKSAKELLLALAVGALFGCASTGAQPSRSQNQENKFDNCVFIMAQKDVVSNDCVQADGGDNSMPYEMFTQTQGNEGSETVSPTATPTQTTDIHPDTNVNTTGGRTAGVLESLIGSFGTWLTTPSGKEATATATAAAAATSSSASCPNGNCSSNGTCTDGSCSSGACTDGSCSVK